jgi:drug/metabolite transporter (DMT)-like permease
MNHNLPIAPFFLSLLGAAIAGTAPIFVRLSEVGPTATGFYRFAFAVPLLAAWWLWSLNQPKPTVNTVKPNPGVQGYVLIMIAGVLFGIDVAMWNYSINHTTVANASMLANLSSIYVSVVSWLLWREHLSIRFIIGMLLALAGCAILIGLNFSFQRANIVGDMLALLASATFGTYMLVMRKLRAYFITPKIMTLSATTSAIVLYAIGTVMCENFVPVSSIGWATLLGLAWITMVLAHGMISWATAYVTPSLTTVGMLIQPAIGTMIAWIMLNESLNHEQLLGIVAIMAGVWLARRGSLSE